MGNEIKLGTIPTGTEGRDAVHITIVPVRTGERLLRGSFVLINHEGCAIRCPAHRAIGIIDPFVDRDITFDKGAWVWLCLFPGKTTSLRHVWEHPSFPKTTEVKPETSSQPSDSVKEESRKWLEAYVREHCPYYEDYPDGGLREFIDRVVDGREIYYAGTDCHGLGDVTDSTELFRHLSIVTNMRIDA